MLSSFCRNRSTEHGGVAIFGSCNLQLKTLDLSPYCTPVHAEFCGVQIINQNCVVVSVYRSSSSGNINIFKQNLIDLLNFLYNDFKSIIIAGDINLNLGSCVSAINDISNIFSMFDLRHCIDEPTRVTAYSSSCLDNIVTNLSTDTISTGVCDPHISDHKAVYIFLLKFQSSTHFVNDWKMSRNVTEKKIIKFSNKLRNESKNWPDFEGMLDSNFLASTLIDLLVSQVDECFPYVRIPDHPPKFRFKWFNRRLRDMRSEMFHLRHRYNITGLHADWDTYVHYRSNYKHSLKQEKRLAYTREIMSAADKNKAVWKLVNNERRPSKVPVSTQLTSDDFNTHFVNICATIVHSINNISLDPFILLQKSPKPSSSFFMTSIVQSDVRESILRMKNSSVIDYYGLNIFMIRASIESLVDPLTILFNKCIEDGNWPDLFKISKITPIHKKGDTECLDNFRPIAILPIINKIFEMLIRDKLVGYCEKYSIFSEAQFGFRKGRSTLRALLKVLETVIGGLDEGTNTDITVCDLTKAFDCVQTDILLQKLEYYGVRGNELKLFKSYLTNRKQLVCLHKIESSILPIENGVPQGSILGPVLFLLYINDLPHSISTACVMYADDTTLLNRQSDCSRDVGLVSADEWFSANKLKLNQSKTKSLVISSDKWTPRSDPVTLLGVTLDTGLNWSAHIQKLCSKISSQIFALRQMRLYLPREVLRTVYFSIVQSHIMYGILLWGQSSTANKVFTLQKAAIRIIDGALPDKPCRPLYKKHKVLPVPCLFILQTLLYIHENIGDFTTYANMHNYGTRHAGDLVAPFSRISITQCNKINLKLFNKFTSIHRDILIAAMPLTKFRLAVKSFLLEHCFYSVDEFMSY